jgi:uncharacterized protein
MPQARAAECAGERDGGALRAAKLRFLGDPASYPERPRRVACVETHFSWVFLTDRHAYKLKKPARGDGFDLRPREARRANAVAELRLNRRLAAGVYLMVVPLTMAPDGGLAIGGSGPAVDWLVKMARLDAELMFDRRIARGDWHYAELEALAHTLARFFATAPTVRLAAPQLAGRIRGELRAALAAAAGAGDRRLGAAMRPAARRLDAFLARRAALFRRRADARIVDGHGDLRPEHVYLKGAPRIIDCLEFRPELRQLDPASELAFLALECRRLGGPDILARLLRRYRRRSRDRPPAALIRFYTGLNAIVRVRIVIEHLAEPGSRTRAELGGRAAQYLAIAARAARSLDRA